MTPTQATIDAAERVEVDLQNKTVTVGRFEYSIAVLANGFDTGGKYVKIGACRSSGRVIVTQLAADEQIDMLGEG